MKICYLKIKKNSFKEKKLPMPTRNDRDFSPTKVYTIADKNFVCNTFGIFFRKNLIFFQKIPAGWRCVLAVFSKTEKV